MKTIELSKKDLLYDPPKNLYAAPLGQGRKITTAFNVQFNGRKRRGYACCFSNTLYIVMGKESYKLTGTGI